MQPVLQELRLLPVIQVLRLLPVLQVLRLHQVGQHMGALYLRYPLVLRKYLAARLVLVLRRPPLEVVRHL